MEVDRSLCCLGLEVGRNGTKAQAVTSVSNHPAKYLTMHKEFLVLGCTHGAGRSSAEDILVVFVGFFESFF